MKHFCCQRDTVLQGHFASDMLRTLRNWVSASCVLLLLLLFAPLFHMPVSAQDVQSESHQPDSPSAQDSLPEQTDEPLELSPELSFFEEIPLVVTASKKPERVTTAPSIISVIRAEDIERMGAGTLMDVLRTIPGVEIVQDRLGVSQIVVRGLREAYSPGVKLLIDGHSLNDPITGGATSAYDDLPLKNVSRIEIIRGPASALYGANAFVSVIHVITKNVEEIDGFKMALGAGSFDSYNPSMLFGKVFNELEVIFSADYFTTNGAELMIEEDGLSDYDRSVQDSGLGPFSLAPGILREEREKLDLSWNVNFRNVSFQGKFLEKHREPFLTNFYLLNHDSFEDTHHIYAELKYRRYFTERLEFDGRLYADSFSLDTHQQGGRGLVFPTQGQTWPELPDGLIVRLEGESQRYGIEGQVNLRTFRNNDLILGAAYEYSGIDDVFFRTNMLSDVVESGSNELIQIQDMPDGVRLSSFQHFAAFFAQDHWQIRPSIGLTLGLRGDYYSEFGGVLTPKAGLTYEPNSTWNFKALLGSAFRVPSFMETFFVGTNLSERGEEGENGIETSDDLVLEELYTFELGMGYQGSDWFTGNLNYFYSDLNQLVEVPEGDDTESLPIGTSRFYKNIGGIDVHGLEGEITGSSEREIDLGVIPRIIGTTFRLNYSYQDARDAETHDRVPDIARHKGNVGVAFNLSAAEDGERSSPAIFRTFSDEFSLYFNLFLCGERQRSIDDSREALPGYATLDTTLKAYGLFHKKLDLAFSMKNVLDKEYYDPSPEYTEGDFLSSIPGDFPNAGRSFFVEFQYTF
ncbi:MAG: TonB-dependent receptor [bacterium]|nr:TonB-dependent receptor [bacterium]